LNERQNEGAIRFLLFLIIRFPLFQSGGRITTLNTIMAVADYC
jgi:hypothetical protein